MSVVPRVSVVCLSYNRPHLLREALASIRAQTCPLLEVLVVDNRSEMSDEVALVVADFPEMTLLANPTNLGFTGGMNTGLRAAAGDYIVITEDDIALAPAAILGVIDRLMNQPSARIVSGIMMNKVAGTIRCAGGEVSLGGRFQMSVLGHNEVDVGQFSEPYTVTYLPGAFLAARQDVWKQLGGFRERYFAYMEDVDLCLRATAAKIPLEVLPAVRIWHAEPPENSAIPDWLGLLKDQNLFRVYLLNAPGWVLPEFLARYGIWETGWRLFHQDRDCWKRVLSIFRTLAELPELLYERQVPPTLHQRTSHGRAAL